MTTDPRIDPVRISMPKTGKCVPQEGWHYYESPLPKCQCGALPADRDLLQVFVNGYAAATNDPDFMDAAMESWYQWRAPLVRSPARQRLFWAQLERAESDIEQWPGWLRDLYDREGGSAQ